VLSSVVSSGIPEPPRRAQPSGENLALGGDSSDSVISLCPLVACSSAMRGVMDVVRRVAPTPSTVLITGETGVGKEMVARAVHHGSALRNRIFLPVNCGAITETLLESQLFGHRRGAFTGAVTDEEGLFRRARGGTIFLDEIADLPLSGQVKLLRVIESKEVLPVGSSTPIRVEVRVIAATNRNLRREVDEGRFREDLYYRLNVVNIEIPPLRERREAIPALVEHLIRLHNRKLKKNVKGADSATMRLLTSLPLNGNVRELDNILEHAMTLGEGDWITVRDLPRAIRDAPLIAQQDSVRSDGDNLREALRTCEREHITAVLSKLAHDNVAAAERLGMSLSTLYRKLDEFEIVSARTMRNRRQRRDRLEQAKRESLASRIPESRRSGNLRNLVKGELDLRREGLHDRLEEGTAMPGTPPALARRSR